ncbi:NlpC/P60 family protein [Herbihabitans rhizosphaerae]|uniref:NlpC/P60 family protein n=1 Tax=Herbihabitans rhizosphaerae TaxID=1872711 RepID=A0A4Q7KK61_9PSEU|nr:C40 family peptidase [Herbihabitans rhizosphaerae]RZS36845.1 NlpC/P60 family protein [Herbihabitans rhizosphaerae]
MAPPNAGPVLAPLVEPGATAQTHLRTDNGGINAVKDAHGNVVTRLDGTQQVVNTNNQNVNANWQGQGADRAVGDQQSQGGQFRDISTYSTQVQSAVQEASGILQVGQNTNQQAIHDFMNRAAPIMEAAAGLRAAGKHADAAAKLSDLAKLADDFNGQVKINLKDVQGQLTGVVDKINGAGGNRPKSGGGGTRTPSAYTQGGGGGRSGGSSGGGGGAASKKRLPAAIPMQPGTGVKVNLPDGSTVEAPNETAAKAVRAALTQLGVPYVWGGTSPGQGLDCSGLTQYAYGEGGMDLPRTSREQDIGAEVPNADSLLPGDLVCWEGHVAMYIGNGQIVEAGDPVQTGPLRTTNSGMPFVGFYRPTG